MDVHPRSCTTTTTVAVGEPRAGALDRALLPEERIDHPDLETEHIAARALVPLCAPGHPLAGRSRPVTWRRPAQESFFLHEEGCSSGGRFARRLRTVPAPGPG
ncbi:LysR substrate-binding domain-containing protein [Streptomyces sp. CAU 1734]|uniref:LysR substrate-binding domain-containing protein n=1 Tax=Streptomyces sp. CAU 1734 TaxID=3140360 RepID=UPI0032618667